MRVLMGTLALGVLVVTGAARAEEGTAPTAETAPAAAPKASEESTESSTERAREAASGGLDVDG